MLGVSKAFDRVNCKKNCLTYFLENLFIWGFTLLSTTKQLPAFPLEAVPGTEPRPQRWEARYFLEKDCPLIIRLLWYVHCQLAC